MLRISETIGNLYKVISKFSNKNIWYYLKFDCENVLL